METVTHLDLFAGIAGFSLAAYRTWGERYRNVGFVEIDEYCQKVIRARAAEGCFGDANREPYIISDIRDVTHERVMAYADRPTNDAEEKADGWGKLVFNDRNQIRDKFNTSSEARGRNERIMALTEQQRLEKSGTQRTNIPMRPSKTKPSEEPEKETISIDLLTGGFPCQPFSCAGKQQGDRDNRFLWPEMLRVIRELQPTWVIGENVAGIINMALDGVLSDLEAEGYAVQAFVIPACAVDAPHRRDRVWIVGYSASPRREAQRGCAQRPREGLAECKGQDVADTGKRRQSGQGPYRDASDKTQGREGETIKPIYGGVRSEWLPESRLDRVAHGISPRMDRPARWPDEPDIPRVATGVKDRVNRLKCLGNAIVPQVAQVLMMAIRTIEEVSY